MLTDSAHPQPRVPASLGRGRAACAFVLVCAVLLAPAWPARADACAGNPDALGTSRVLEVSSADHPRVGREQHPESLNLADHEVVLTFDDGPLRPSTARVLDALKAECVKATFFVVGAMAARAPDLVRRAYDEGHTIGTHTQTHPHLPTLGRAEAEADIARGIASASTALTPARALAPFFRAPYLQTTPAIDRYVASQGLMLWGIDFHAGDWDKISPAAVVARAMERLERQHKGILLLHDIQHRTAVALPTLLRELKRRGYRIVHVVPRPAQSARVQSN